jgi:hypothetical protein
MAGELRQQSVRLGDDLRMTGCGKRRVDQLAAFSPDAADRQRSTCLVGVTVGSQVAINQCGEVIHKRLLLCRMGMIER